MKCKFFSSQKDANGDEISSLEKQELIEANIKQKNLQDKTNQEVGEIMLPFKEDDLVRQYGETCKLMSIATLDRFFSRTCGFLPIPAFKNSKGVYGDYKSGISLRQLARTIGSTQGELLEIRQYKELLDDNLGYKTNILTIDDEDDFRQTIIAELKKGQPCISFFLIDRKHGNPILSDDKSLEHACIITGYNSSNDSLRITHWGRHYDVPFKSFYKSNQSLADTRQQEQYLSLVRLYNLLFGSPNKTALQKKYYLIDKEHSTTELAEKIFNANDIQWEIDVMANMMEDLIEKSIIPQKDSGFKGKLICISALTEEQCQDMLGSELRMKTFEF